MNKTYRLGGVGAMMDEYERAAEEFLALLRPLDAAQYEKIRDPNTADKNCRSIQTVASHVVESGHWYSNQLRKAFGMPSTPPPENQFERDEIESRIKEMLAYTVETLEGRWLLSDDEIVAIQMRSPDGAMYDLEQRLEHAIVHILRHRRQVERFLTA